MTNTQTAACVFAVLVKLTDEQVLHRFIRWGRHFEQSARIFLPGAGLLYFDQVRLFGLFSLILMQS